MHYEHKWKLDFLPPSEILRVIQNGIATDMFCLAPGKSLKHLYHMGICLNSFCLSSLKFVRNNIIANVL